VLGPEHPDTALGLNNLAFVLNAQGRYAEAEPLYRRALAIKEKVFGEEHDATALSLENLSLLLVRIERYEEAVSFARRAFASRLAFLGQMGASAAEVTRGQSLERTGSVASALMRSAWASQSVAGADLVSLRGEAFSAAQMIAVSGAAEALARGAARVAADRAGAGAAVDGWRAAQARVTGLDTAITNAASRGEGGDDLRVQLMSDRQEAIRSLASVEAEIAASFPRFFSCPPDRKSVV